MPNNGTALVVIDMQKGFLDSQYWGHRNNPLLEVNIRRLIAAAREFGTPIVHVQHLSTESESPLNPSRTSVDFMDCAKPKGEEPIFTKCVNSAFIGTSLESYLRQNGFNTLILVGLTSDHCVSTSARMAANLGFQALLASDATATFDRIGYDGESFAADLVHRVSLASLHKEFVTIMETSQIIEQLIQIP